MKNNTTMCVTSIDAAYPATAFGPGVASRSRGASALLPIEGTDATGLGSADG